MTIMMNGSTFSGKPVSIQISLSLSRLISKVDVLAELPYVLRIFLQTFITAPYLYQWIESTVISVDIDGEKIDLSGTAFYEAVFMTRMPSEVCGVNWT